VISKQRVIWNWTRRVIGGVLLLGIGYLILAPTGRYLLRAAWAEGKILRGRR